MGGGDTAGCLIFLAFLRLLFPALGFGRFWTAWFGDLDGLLAVSFKQHFSQYSGPAPGACLALAPAAKLVLAISYKSNEKRCLVQHLYIPRQLLVFKTAS